MAAPSNNLVTTHWLADKLGSANVAVLDASRHLPAAKRDPRAEFEAGHIPSARFLDLASWCDTTSEVPAALPNAAQVAERLAALGVTADATIILYDDSGVKTAARAWFTLRAHGVENVAILDGGLTKWRADGLPLESGTADIDPAPAAQLPAAQNVVFKTDMLANIESCAHQVLDARGADRVFGLGIDPVHGGQNGRIPGSLNLPFGEVFTADGTFKSPTELRETFAAAGVDPSRPLITTCGSGVTACVLLFAAHLAGITDTKLYDGSWMEWESDPDMPKKQGPA
ncbi:sulfurtransferase [uncultured Erythrobacter sp.]|uniref:sulfurtransferase n=1 Tax=uncultured Erythrobacter sp. TaxID=263913 RepID=UPI002614E9F8|nr:sulfurtransferase [uncultured Erythrobacter sp.]